MENYSKKICKACGTEYDSREIKNNHCKICDDDRQYIPEGGQAWTTEDELLKSRSVQIKSIYTNLYELTILPSFAIGQRAFLIISENGNILWDCIPLLDESAIAFINSKGGLKGIAISHPHYYSNLQTWASIFNCPVYIHEKDKEWTPKNDAIHLWSGEVKFLWDEIKIINTGGHFPGACILRVPFLSENGTVFCGDSLFVSRSKKHIAIMYSYPNQIPVPVSEIKRIRLLLEKYQFDSLYGAFSFQNLTSNVKIILAKSMDINMRQYWDRSE